MSQIVSERLARSRLVGAPFASPAAVVEGLLAVQSQDLTGAAWAVGCRADASQAEVMAAYDRGEILRTHAMRPTWHFVAPADLRWLQQLTKDRVHRLAALYYRRGGLTPAIRSRGTERIARALEGGKSLTREELAAELAKSRITLKGEALAHLVMHAELEAVVTSGPMRGKQTTYALVAERVPPARERTRDEALGELVRRYVESHGPVTPHDCAWWSGLTLADVRRGAEIAGGAIEVRGEHWIATAAIASPPRSRTPRMHLLSNYDEYLIAYKDRSDFMGPDAVRKLGPPERVFAAHFALEDGLLVGGWRRELSQKELVIELRIIALSAAATRALEKEAARIGRFYGVPARIVRA
jgi:hypothetical protein